MVSVWWVNQGSTYAKERSGGYLWAPTKNKAGTPVFHHVNVSRLRPGDTVIHYADGMIRAVSVIKEPSKLSERPSGASSGTWQPEGFLALAEYHELDKPIPIGEVPSRTPDIGPFDRAGGVKQGYLFLLTPRFVELLGESFADRLPISLPSQSQTRPVWLFQANPGQWNLREELKKKGAGDDEDWVVTRFRDQMEPGDIVVLWQSGPDAGIYALAQIDGKPFMRERPEWRGASASGSTEDWAVNMHYIRVLSEPILKARLLDDPILGQISVIRAPQGTNFRLKPQEWNVLKGMIGMGWDEFIFWGKKFKDGPRFDHEERDYKLRLAAQLADVRARMNLDEVGWNTALVSALTSKDNNILNWRSVQKVTPWIKGNPNELRPALAHLWDGPSPGPNGVTAFSAALPPTLGLGPSAVLTFASLLLMGVGADQFPPYRKTAFEKAVDLVGYPRWGAGSDPSTIYKNALDFLDRIIKEAAARGLELRDRLDAQGILWAVVSGTPLDAWQESDRVRFEAFVGGGPSIIEPGDELDDLAQELYLDADYLRRVEKLLMHKRQVIFYGPPGTGKTFVAKRLAEYFARGDGVVEKVQFHPSYAYEDFVEGYRPRLKGEVAGFELLPGPLRRIAAAAHASPKATFVLLIDEINRGNVAKVFGELYYLLEYRNEEISLLYSAQQMALPENLWIIGTMNTADRSIALVDAALRRRFHFVPFYPDRPPVEGLLRRWLQANKPSLTWVADVVDRANESLPGSDMGIGPSHFMRMDLDEEWVGLIWEHSVLPYIAEQFFGDDARVESFSIDRLRKASASDGGQDEG